MLAAASFCAVATALSYLGIVDFSKGPRGIPAPPWAQALLFAVLALGFSISAIAPLSMKMRPAVTLSADGIRVHPADRLFGRERFVEWQAIRSLSWHDAKRGPVAFIGLWWADEARRLKGVTERTTTERQVQLPLDLVEPLDALKAAIEERVDPHVPEAVAKRGIVASWASG